MASSSGAALPVAQAGSEPPTTGLTVEQDKVVPLTVTLAEAGEVRRYDILAMHEKASGILATIKAGNETLCNHASNI